MVARNNAECAKVSIARDDGFSCPGSELRGATGRVTVTRGIIMLDSFPVIYWSCYSANNNGNEKRTRMNESEKFFEN